MIRLYVSTILLLITAACHQFAPSHQQPISAQQNNEAVKYFQNVRDSLQILDSGQTFGGFIAKYEYLKLRFQDSRDSNILKMVLDTRRYIPVTDETILAMDEGRVPSELIEIILAGLCYSALLNGEVHEAVAYQEQLLHLYPDSKLLQNESKALQLAVSAKFKLDSIAKIDLSPDERLWALGNIWERYVENDLFAGEYWYSYALARPYFEELISKYPDSPWADNAAFSLVSESFAGAGEGGDVSYGVMLAEAYENVLNQYPETDCKASIMLVMAYYYLEFDDSAVDDPNYINRIIESCQRGIAILDERMKLFPNDPKNDEAAELLALLNRKINIFGLQLNISANKEIYKVGEPILVKFKLSNPTGDTVQFKPEFTESCPNIRFQAINESPQIPKDVRTVHFWTNISWCLYNNSYIRLDPGGTYHESWDITRKIFSRSADCADCFPSPGDYLISGSLGFEEPISRMVRSDTIRITIEE